ncbi:hypothetical protein DL95DRAFT_417829 [Leptodontidium sp. 2 PMI_412]|nr:hypothetical protein DL95DRAFT_417829 [Leptodontidium sp. 2 PMI_412]
MYEVQFGRNSSSEFGPRPSKNRASHPDGRRLLDYNGACSRYTSSDNTVVVPWYTLHHGGHHIVALTYSWISRSSVSELVGIVRPWRAVHTNHALGVLRISLSPLLASSQPQAAPVRVSLPRLQPRPPPSNPDPDPDENINTYTPTPALPGPSPHHWLLTYHIQPEGYVSAVSTDEQQLNHLTTCWAPSNVNRPSGSIPNSTSNTNSSTRPNHKLKERDITALEERSKPSAIFSPSSHPSRTEINLPAETSPSPSPPPPISTPHPPQ